MVGRLGPWHRACPFREDHDLATIVGALPCSCDHLLQRSRIPRSVNRDHRRLQRIPTKERIPQQFLLQDDRRCRHHEERNEHVQHAIVLARIKHRTTRHVLAAAYFHADAAKHFQPPNQAARIQADRPERHRFRQQQCRKGQQAQNGHQPVHPDYEQDRTKHHHWTTR